MLPGLILPQSYGLQGLPSASYTGSLHLASPASNDTYFSGFSFGAAHPDRYVIIGVVTDATSSHDSVTIGGAPATKLGGGGAICSLWIAKIPTGTDGIVNVKTGSTPQAIRIFGYRVVGLRFGGKLDTWASGNSGSISVNAKDYSLVLAVARGISSSAWSPSPELGNTLLLRSSYGLYAGVSGVRSVTTPQSYSISYSGSTRILMITLR